MYDTIEIIEDNILVSPSQYYLLIIQYVLKNKERLTCVKNI